MGRDAGTAAGLRYRLLGPVEAYSADGRLPLGGPKPRAVLAVLLLQANKVVAEERFFELVWGERRPRSVRGRLQVYVSELRSLLGQDAITRTGGGYRITVAPGELDLQVFDDARARAGARLRAGRAEGAAEQLRAALRFWRTPVLGGVTEALAAHERQGLEERRLGAREELFDAELAAGRHVQIVRDLRQAVTEHPLRERLTGQLMRALHSCQRGPEALRVYAETRRRLVDERGIEPGEGLREIQAQVLASVADRDNGPQCSRGVFVGRDDELAALDAQMSGDEGGIWVISGTAGVGKTALAQRWAHRAAQRFPGGQLSIDLRGYDVDNEPVSPAAALSQLLRALGAAPPGGLPDTVSARAALYRSLLADRRMLVLLDNARDAAQVVPLLPASGAVLVTSRHRLGELVVRAGARSMPLSALSAEEAYTLLESALGPDRLAAEAASTAELLRLCAGLPLALRIASARLAARPAAPIAAVVTELARGCGALAAAFDASYQALRPDQQRLFRLLGLVPGPDFTPATAAAVAGIATSRALRLLGGLTAAHLVEQHEAGRYRLHNLIRGYAAARVCADPDRDPARARLIEHNLSLTVAGTKRPAVTAPSACRCARSPNATTSVAARFAKPSARQPRNRPQAKGSTDQHPSSIRSGTRSTHCSDRA
jgi:DNA-binding SARP family transcriptional activator